MFVFVLTFKRFQSCVTHVFVFNVSKSQLLTLREDTSGFIVKEYLLFHFNH